MRRGGFTVLESLVTLLLISLFVGLSVQLVRPISPRLRMEAMVRSLCGALKATRSRAIAFNREIVLTADLENKVFSSPGDEPLALPGEARVELIAARLGRTGDLKGAIVFFPDGASSGADLTIRLADVRVLISTES
jgi:general secretion pathway protein H